MRHSWWLPLSQDQVDSNTTFWKGYLIGVGCVHMFRVKTCAYVWVSVFILQSVTKLVKTIRRYHTVSDDLNWSAGHRCTIGFEWWNEENNLTIPCETDSLENRVLECAWGCPHEPHYVNISMVVDWWTFLSLCANSWLLHQNSIDV